MVKCQCRKCGGVLDFELEKLYNPKIENDFGHFKFIKECNKYCKKGLI